MLGLGAPCGIHISGDRGEAKIRDFCMTRVVHKNIWLGVCQCDGGIIFRTTYSLEVPMNDTAGVEVAEALGDIR
jgi:hypothetical protein